MSTSPVMTVTDELLAELELLASKATQGKWWIDSHGHTMIAADTLDVVFLMPSTKGAVRHPETGNLSSWRNNLDASYIAAANPKNMQMLLTELRRLRAENAELAKDAGRYQWLRDAGELTPDQFSAINEWLWGDGDFTYIAQAIDTAMQTDQ